MNQKQFTAISRQLNDALAPAVINELGRQSGFCRRERLLSPMQTLICLITTMACEKTETVADIQRRFVEWTGLPLSYRAVYSQLSKPEFPVFMREALSHLLSLWVSPAQQFVEGSAYARFERILLQDGSSFALSEHLRDAFPGRFSTVSPAAVELHVTMDLLADQPESISLTADTASERDYLPAVDTLQNDLILVDRGYFDLDWFYRLDAAGGFFIGRCLNDVNPTITQAWSESGRRLKFAQGSKLKSVTRKLLTRKRTELEVSWPLSGQRSLHVRLIAFWNEEEQRHTWLITNLPRDAFNVADVSDGYRLRWQIELLFKEWKSYANLHKFNTGNRHLAEGLIWASIAAAVFKRFLCMSAERLVSHRLSTRRVAMSGHSTMVRMMVCLLKRRLREARLTLKSLLVYLGNCAQRAHPKRERKRGRSKLGLEIVGYA